MKILWLCNIMLPFISEALNEAVSNQGGWLSGLCDNLVVQPDCELFVCLPYAKGTPVRTGKEKGVTFYGFKESEKNEEVFCTILEEISPDIIHIWGTEFNHSLDMVDAAEQRGLLDRVVINIQGLVSIIGKYHYYCGIPEHICKSPSLIERKYHMGIENDRQSFLSSGKYEVEAIKKVKHVIGRTDWDKACTKQINPTVNYYFCNESLRSSFYENRWSIDACEKHSIFTSQSHYPIKGFHLMLEAMPLILQRFPDAHLYTTGREPRKPENWKYKINYESYPRYLRNLLDKYKLNEHVSFLDSLDERQMCEQYLRSNVFVSPSSIENSSNSVCEAMLLGIPVVSSDVGGIKNLMEHEKEGFIYQWDAPYMLAYYVCKVFEVEDQAVTLGTRARERALRTHDREKNLLDTMEIYREVLHSSAQQK